MNNFMKKIVILCMAIALCIGLVPAQALAYVADEGLLVALGDPQVVDNSYQFTATVDSNRQLSDSFTFREDCFAQSSFVGCSHLAVLSSQVAAASQSWFGTEETPFEDNVDETDHNVSAMLCSMGFADVEVNGYYRSEMLPDSIGVAVGHRMVKDEGKDYTLLAIFPRSAGYKTEWVGNVTLGDDDFHQGFKDARDEVLRFVKKYVVDHKITGSLKIWTAGHSRGAAVSNLVAGFFAGGGVSYLGDAVSTTPEDVYGYAFASPRTVKTGASRSRMLSVSGPRGGAYTRDTQVEAYVSTAKGELDPHDASLYGGLRNYTQDIDIVTSLIPTSWGFTCYGAEIAADGGVADTDDMLAQLSTLSPRLYDTFLNGADPRGYESVTPDLINIDLNALGNDGSGAQEAITQIPTVSAEGVGDATLDQFVARRAAGLVAGSSSNADFVAKGSQDALQAILGVTVLAKDRVLPDGVGGMLAMDDQGLFVKSLVLGYLGYASSRLQLEGRVSNDAEATEIVLKELLSLVAGEPIEFQTVDEFFAEFTRIVSENADTPLVQSVMDKLVALIPSDSQSVVATALGVFTPGFNVWEFRRRSDEAKASELKLMLLNYFRACCKGPAKGSSASMLYKDASEVRRSAYAFIPSISTAWGIDSDALSQALGTNKDGTVDGSGAAVDVIALILNAVLAVKDADGNVISTYPSLAEAAACTLADAVDSVSPTVLAKANEAYGTQYQALLSGFFDQFKSHSAQVLTLAFNMLFYVDGQAYSTAYNLATVATGIRSLSAIASNHQNEVYIAWMRAVQAALGDDARHPYTFVDVGGDVAHSADIEWLSWQGISTGWQNADGTREFRPFANVTRCDMAAFLFRLAKSWGMVDDAWQPKGGFVFEDVTTSTPHYLEVMWLAENGISEGWERADGKREFRPYASIARADAAAFLHRLSHKRSGAGEKTKPSDTSGVAFYDVTTSVAHREDIEWLASKGVSRGWSRKDGTSEFRPYTNIARADMAAFLHGLDAI